MTSSLKQYIGHKHIAGLLLKQLTAGQVMGSYLFYGRKGLGKSVLARMIAKDLLQTENLSGNPDFHYYQHSGSSDVANLRTFAKILGQKPVQSKVSVLIIEGVENFSKEESNSLLKLLEEPSKTSIVFLISSTNRSLPTIVSRCISFHFGSLTRLEILEIAKKLDLPKEQLDLSLKAGCILQDPTTKEVYDIIQNLNDLDPNLTWKFLASVKKLSSLEHEEKDELLYHLTSLLDLNKQTGLTSPKSVSYINQKSLINLNKKLFWQGLLFI
jgi:DNA polymerase III delta prime subunit